MPLCSGSLLPTKNTATTAGSSGALVLRVRQRTRLLNLELLELIATIVLGEYLALEDWELGIHFVGKGEIARLNQHFLNHAGPTDVISFDYSPADAASPLDGVLSTNPAPKRVARDLKPTSVKGEIFICVDEAVRQAPC